MDFLALINPLMDFLSLTAPLSFALLIVLAIYWFVQKRRPETLSDAAAMIIEAERVARILVAGAQQIYESDQTDGQDYRYEQVEAALLDVFPQLVPRHAKQIIEAAVLGFKEARARGWLPQVKEDPPLTLKSDAGEFTLDSDRGDTLRVWREIPEGE